MSYSTVTPVMVAQRALALRAFQNKLLEHREISSKLKDCKLKFIALAFINQINIQFLYYYFFAI